MDDTAQKEHAQIINQSQVAGGCKAMVGLPTALLKNAIKCFLLCLLRQRRVIMKKPGTDSRVSSRLCKDKFYQNVFQQFNFKKSVIRSGSPPS